MVMFWQTATGASLSSTVIVKLHAVVFSPPSVAVNSTVLTPTGKLLPLANPLVCVTVTLQLSDADGVGKVTTALHIPASALIIMSAGQVIVGGILSSTVTTATQVPSFPFISVTVRVTLFSPISRSEERRVGKECRSRWSRCY